MSPRAIARNQGETKRPVSRAALASAITLVASVLFYSSVAQAAQRAYVALSWLAPAGCATQPELEQQLRPLTAGRALESSRGNAHAFEIVARLGRQDGGWRANITLIDSDGNALASLVIATLLDGLSQRTAAPARSTHVPVKMTSFVAVAQGLGPGARLGAGLGLEWSWAVPVAFDATAYLPSQQLDENRRGARFWGVHGGASACPGKPIHSFSLRLCSGAQAGAVRAEGAGLDESRSAWLPLVLIGLEPQLLWALSEVWTVQLAVAARWAVVNPQFDWSIAGEGPSRLTLERFSFAVRFGLMIQVPSRP
jgi:hypothetical protein